MKKRVLLSIFCVILTVIAVSFTSFADEFGNFSITIENTSGNGGDIVPVNVVISENPGIISINMSVIYDNEKLQLLEVEDGGILGKEILHQDHFDSPYTLSWANYTTDQVTRQTFNENGTLCTLKFRVLKAETNEDLPIKIVLPEYGVMDFDLNEITTTTFDGTIHIVQGGIYRKFEPLTLIGIGAALILIGVAVFEYGRKSGKTK